MKVSLMNVKRQYELHKEEYDKVLLDTAASGLYIGGGVVREFENKFANYVGAKYAVSCGSGTDALILALRAYNIGEGDEIIVPSFTFFATAEAIANVRATPIFVDVEEDSYCIDPSKIEEKITERTKGIIAVHFYGNCADMDAIRKIANKYDLKIVTDCAQAIGTKSDGSIKNVLGDIACFSFFPTKNLGGIGDGGMITTDEEYIALAVRSYGAHGSGRNFEQYPEESEENDKYHNHHIGYNSRLDALQAAFLGKKLEHLDELLESRAKIADYYMKNLDPQKYHLPKIKSNITHSFYLFVIRHEKATDIMRILNDRGIESKPYYPIPTHLQEAFKNLKCERESLPITERLCKTTFAIPLFPGMTEDEMNYVVDTLNHINPEEIN